VLNEKEKLMRIVVVMLLTLVALMQAPSAHAARGRFGTDDELRSIQETKIQNAGHNLWLARKIRTENFLLPYMIADDGYVLADATRSYFELDEAKIKDYQAQGLLPNPLPPFKFEIGDYAWGYSLWLLIAGVAAWSGISALWSRRKREAA
jgi:uncharacterized protein